MSSLRTYVIKWLWYTVLLSVLFQAYTGNIAKTTYAEDLFHKEFSFDRPILSWDTIQGTINGNTISITASGSQSNIIEDIRKAFHGNGVTATSSGTTILLDASGSIIVSDVKVTHASYPTIIQLPELPTPQKSIIENLPLLNADDEISLSIESDTYTTTGGVTALVNLINSSGNFLANQTGTSIEITGNSWEIFAINEAIIHRADIFPETNVRIGIPSIELTVTGTIVTTGSLNIGNCTVTIEKTGISDYDCADGSAYINIGSWDDTPTVLAQLSSILGIDTGSGDILEWSISGSSVYYSLVIPKIYSNDIAVTSMGEIAITSSRTGKTEYTITFPFDIEARSVVSISTGSGLIHVGFTNNHTDTLNALVSTLKWELDANVSLSWTHTIVLSEKNTPFTIQRAEVDQVLSFYATQFAYVGKKQMNSVLFPTLVGDEGFLGNIWELLISSPSNTLSGYLDEINIATGSVLATLSGSSEAIFEVTTTGSYINMSPFYSYYIVSPISTFFTYAPINTQQVLGKNSTSTSTVASNRNGSIFVILSGTIINDISNAQNAVSTNAAILVRDNDAIAYNGYTVTSTPSLTSGAYNIYAFDLNGNIAYANGWLIIDTSAPSITLNGSGTTIVEINNEYTESGATWTDNIDGSGVVADIVSTVNTGTLGTYTVTYTYVDTSGNTGSATRTVEVRDTTAPVVTLNTGSDVIEVNSSTGWTDAGAEWVDNNGNTGSLLANSGSVTPSVVGTYTVEYLVSDGYNTGSATRTVEVRDTTAPVVTLNTGSDVIEVNSSTGWTDAGAEWVDNNGNTGSLLANSGSVTPSVVGTYTVEYLVSDGYNTGSATRTVEVRDTTAPVVTLNTGSDVIEINTSWTDAGALWVDNNGNTGSLLANSGSVTPSVVGTYTVEYLVSDGYNTGSATRTVEVRDTTAPVVTLNTGSDVIEVNSSTGWTDAGALWVDNNGNTGSLLANSGSVTPSVVGTYTVEYLVSDGYNTGSTTRTVEVRDTTAPVVTLNTGSDVIEVNSSTGWTDAGAEWVDNNGNTGSLLANSGSVTPSVVGTYTVEYLVSDGYNTGSATRTVEVRDTTAPVVTLNTGSDVIEVNSSTGWTDAGAEWVDNNGNTGSLLANSGSVTPSVVGTYTVEYLVSDGYNTGSATRTVEVRDTTAPVVTLNTGSDVIEINTSWTDAGALWVDNNGNTGSLLANSGSVTPSVVGTYTVEYLVSDGYNTGSATRTVEVRDTTAPVVTLNTGSDVIEINTSWTDAGALWVDNNGNTGSLLANSGSVTPSVVGTYTVEYLVSDGYNTGSTTRTVSVVDTTAPVVTTNTGSDVIEINTSWTDAGALWVDNNGNTGSLLANSGSVTPSVVGTYTVEYLVSDGYNTGSTTRTVSVVDTTAPVVTTNTGSDVIEINTSWTDAGALWVDNNGNTGSLLANSGSVTPSVVGTYTVEYLVSDGYNTGSTTRTVSVVDTTAPVVILSGTTTMETPLGTPFNDPGATWSDNNGSFWEVSYMSWSVYCNNFPTLNNAYICGFVNVMQTGSYTIDYIAIDSDGNTGSVSRIVIVVDNTGSGTETGSGTTGSGTETGSGTTGSGTETGSGTTGSGTETGSGTTGSGTETGSGTTGSGTETGSGTTGSGTETGSGTTGSGTETGSGTTGSGTETGSGTTGSGTETGSGTTGSGTETGSGTTGSGTETGSGTTGSGTETGSGTTGSGTETGSGTTGSGTETGSGTTGSGTETGSGTTGSGTETGSGTTGSGTETGSGTTGSGTETGSGTTGSGTETGSGTTGSGTETGSGTTGSGTETGSGTTGSGTETGSGTTGSGTETGSGTTGSGTETGSGTTGSGTETGSGTTGSGTETGSGTTGSGTETGSGTTGSGTETGSGTTGSGTETGSGTTGSGTETGSGTTGSGAIDTIAPVISLSGSSPMDVAQFGIFADPGATCTDNIDTTCTVIASGTIDTAIVGTYTILYIATDNAGNSSSVGRFVNIVSGTTGSGTETGSGTTGSGTTGSGTETGSGTTGSGTTGSGTETGSGTTGSGTTGSGTETGSGTTGSGTTGSGTETGSGTTGSGTTGSGTETGSGTTGSGTTGSGTETGSGTTGSGTTGSGTETGSGTTGSGTTGSGTETGSGTTGSGTTGSGTETGSGTTGSGTTGSGTETGSGTTGSGTTGSGTETGSGTTGSGTTGSGTETGSGTTGSGTTGSGTDTGSGTTGSGTTGSGTDTGSGTTGSGTTGSGTDTGSGTTGSGTTGSGTDTGSGTTGSGTTGSGTDTGSGTTGSGTTGSGTDTGSGTTGSGTTGSGTDTGSGTTGSGTTGSGTDTGSGTTGSGTTGSGTDTGSGTTGSGTTGSGTETGSGTTGSGTTGSGTETGSGTTGSGYVIITNNITGTGTATVSTGTVSSGTTIDTNGYNITTTSPLGSLSIPGSVDFRTSWGTWDGILIAPTENGSGTLELTEFGVMPNLPADTTTLDYTHQAITTIQAGANGVSLIASGGTFTLSVNITSSGVNVGDTLTIFRSNDGSNWILNTPTSTCTVNASRVCTFTTDHLSYFGFVKTTSVAITQPETPTTTVRPSGRGASLIMDYCPNGDTSASYYDKDCGVGTIGTGIDYTKKINTVKNSLPRKSSGALLENAAKKLAEEIISEIKKNNSTPEAQLLEISKVLDTAKKLRDSEKDAVKRNFLNRFIRYIEAEKNRLSKTLPKQIIPTTPVEKYIPYTPKKPVNGPILQETTYTGIYQYTTVSHAVNVHGTKAYGTKNLVGNIYRNERVITVESTSDGWSFIVFRSGKAGYIRTRFLRDATREDLIRDGVLDAKYGEQRTITVVNSVYLRKSPYYGAKILGVLRNGDKVTKLDALNRFTEVLTEDEKQWYVKSRYVK